MHVSTCECGLGCVCVCVCVPLNQERIHDSDCLVHSCLARERLKRSDDERLHP
jgi:hypothetical protein